MDDLWTQALTDLAQGNFSRLQKMLGGPEGFDKQIVAWHEKGYFNSEPEMVAEAFTCACMLGRAETGRYLLDKGVDPVAGMKTGLTGFHSRDGIDVVKLLIDRRVPMEIENMYSGTVFGQSLWSAVNEHQDSHAVIIEALVEAGARIETGTLEWWEKQDVPSSETKKRVAETLRNTGVK